MTERKWTLWSDQRPPNECGTFRYRVRANILGIVVMPEWSERMSLCGMGYADSEWWPLTPCHWDGYQRYITHKGLEWSEPRDDDPKGVIWGGINLLPCPFTGAQPTIVAYGRYIGAPIWHSEALSISSPAVPSRRWTDAKAMCAAWNRRYVPAMVEASQ